MEISFNPSTTKEFTLTVIEENFGKGLAMGVGPIHLSNHIPELFPSPRFQGLPAWMKGARDLIFLQILDPKLATVGSQVEGILDVESHQLLALFSFDSLLMPRPP